ncbi:MAG: hypothetical protein K2Q26_14630 [Bdellovibrionales bacterium]|nr:hypothetical protein [Bdellovibrionales bacterium]
MPFLLRGLLVSASLIATSVQAYEYQKPQIPLSPNFQESAQQFRRLIENEQVFNAQTCSAKLKQIYESMYALDPKYYLGAPEGEKNNQALLSSQLSENPVNTFFDSRVAIRKKFRDWVWGNKFKNYDELYECARYLKVASRTLRTFEDYWGLYRLQKSTQTLPVVRRMEGVWPYTMVNTSFHNEKYTFPLTSEPKTPNSLQTGDMLLSRGQAFSSAAISRIGNIDNQFSHLALVYIDEKAKLGIANKIYIIEAELDNGVQITALDYYLKDAKARIGHYRYIGDGKQDDATLRKIRAQAAELMLDQFFKGKYPTDKETLQKIYSDRFASGIGYNFAMDMKNENTLFCSQVVSYAYGLSCKSLGNCVVPKYQPSDRTYPFPLVYSQLDSTSNPIIRMLGIKGGDVFAPADVEIDPQLELIAEWRDYGVIEGRRIHDMVITKVFQWMEVGGYDFKSSELIDQISIVAEVLVKSLGKMPPETPPGYIRGTILLGYLLEAPGVRADEAQALLKSYLGDYVGKTEIDAKKAKEIGEKIKSLLLKMNIPVDARTEELIANEQLQRAVVALLNNQKLGNILSYVGMVKQMTWFAERFHEKFNHPPTDYDLDRTVENLRILTCKEFKEGKDRFFLFFAPQKTACSMEAFDWRQLW